MRRIATLTLSLAALAGLACELADEPIVDAQAELSETGLDADAELPASDPIASPDLPAAEATPEPLEIDVDDNQGCVDCHPDAAATWRGSLHQRAWVEPAFATSYSREPLAFCRTCHAPRADPAAEPPAELAALGVDCVSCHVRDGVVHTGPGEGAASELGHSLVREENFGETACAGCHQFEFPRKAHRVPGTLMQKTMLEHEDSEWAELSCADCHFPANDDGLGRNHGLAISRNVDLLRNSLIAEVSWVDADRVVFALEPNGVGHRFPTGDLFRRLELRVELLDEGGEVIGTERRYLARQFEAVQDGHGRIGEARDDRLSGPAQIGVALAGGRDAAELRWSVRYQRVDSRDHARPERSKLAGEVELASGTLAGPG